MSEIDWSKAPKYATHCHVSNQKYPWRLLSHGVYFAWIEREGWMVVAEDESHLYVARPSGWSGEGMPPVGTLCEALRIHHGNDWTKVTILGVGKSRIFWTDDRGEEMSRLISEVQFRPLRTPEQIAAEEREKAIDEIASLIGRGTFAEDAAAIYDAGYRKVEGGAE